MVDSRTPKMGRVKDSIDGVESRTPIMGQSQGLQLWGRVKNSKVFNGNIAPKI